MPPKPILCTCGKRFKNNDAMHQHQRASSFHVDAPHLAERQLPLDNLVQRLSLQDQEADHGVRGAD